VCQLSAYGSYGLQWTWKQEEIRRPQLRDLYYLTVGDKKMTRPSSCTSLEESYPQTALALYQRPTILRVRVALGACRWIREMDGLVRPNTRAHGEPESHCRAGPSSQRSPSRGREHFTKQHVDGSSHVKRDSSLLMRGEWSTSHSQPNTCV